MEMVIKIDKQGRVVLPKELREKYHFDPESELTVIERPEGIILKKSGKKIPIKDVCSPGLTFDPKNVLAIDIANLDDDLEDIT